MACVTCVHPPHGTVKTVDFDTVPLTVQKRFQKLKIEKGNASQNHFIMPNAQKHKELVNQCFTDESISDQTFTVVIKTANFF